MEDSLQHVQNTHTLRGSNFGTLTKCDKSISQPGLVMDDTSAIRWATEKLGGTTPNLTSMQCFNNCIDYCSLVEFPLAGSQFSWSNSSTGSNWIECKLYRALVNDHFLQSAYNFEEPSLIQVFLIISQFSSSRKTAKYCQWRWILYCSKGSLGD